MKVAEGSFRDPAGFVYQSEGIVLRQINDVYEPHYRQLVESGLAEDLVARGLLLPFEEVGEEHAFDNRACRVLRPKQLPFVAYPYEWCFSQLRDAALATLEIQLVARRHGMTLKDATPFNIQFVRGRPCLIDHLSFESSSDDSPWIAYRQFCETFYAPLAVASAVGPEMSRLLRAFPEGASLKQAVRSIPKRLFLRPTHFLHLAIHSLVIDRFTSAGRVARERGMTSTGMERLVKSLKSGISALGVPKGETGWGGYRLTDSYSEGAAAGKREIVRELLGRLEPASVWDLGANTGAYSGLAAEGGARVVAIDQDAQAVETLYQRIKDERRQVQPLFMDLCNPSPGLGWASREFESLLERGPATAVLALALIHHLVLSRNVPLRRIAEFLAGCAEYSLVEFVPDSDPRVRQLLDHRLTPGHEYNRHLFERAFSAFGRILERRDIPESKRTLYLIRNDR